MNKVELPRGKLVVLRLKNFTFRTFSLYNSPRASHSELLKLQKCVECCLQIVNGELENAKTHRQFKKFLKE